MAHYMQTPLSFEKIKDLAREYFFYPFQPSGPLCSGITLDCSHARVRSPGLGEQVDGVAPLQTWRAVLHLLLLLHLRSCAIAIDMCFSVTVPNIRHYTELHCLTRE
jgi:hypothetical protein